MKIALLGTGRTGSKVMDIHDDVVGFNTSNPPGESKLSECDVAISFLPGETFLDYIELLLSVRIPVVTGTTGFSWPENFDLKLKEIQLSWIKAHNFSLGMNVVREMIYKMSYLDNLFEDGEYNIHEIHHKHKKDAPSGTAISWKEWLNRDAEISSERKGDIVGYHQLQFDCNEEKITLIHEAKDRSIFARGAVWAAKILYVNKGLDFGLLDFNQVVKDKLNL